MSTRFFFLCFKSRWISVKTCLTAPYYFPVIFNFMGTIAFLTLRTMCTTSKSNIFLLPTIWILRNTRIHIDAWVISHQILMREWYRIKLKQQHDVADNCTLLESLPLLTYLTSGSYYSLYHPNSIQAISRMWAAKF